MPHAATPPSPPRPESQDTPATPSTSDSPRRLEAVGRHLPVLVEGGVVLQRADVLRLLPLEERADGELDLLARPRVRDLLHLLDQRGDVGVGGAVADLRADLLLELLRQLGALRAREGAEA